MADPKKKKPTTSKTKKRPAAKRRPRKKISFRKQMIKVAVGMGALMALVVAAAMLTNHLMIRKKPVSLPPAPTYQAPAPKTPAPKPKRPEVVKTADPLQAPPKLAPLPLPPPIEPSQSLPRVAIIIDDVGQDRRIVKQLLALDMNLTFSILPYSPYNGKLSRIIRQADHEIMLHLPMEPHGYPDTNPGPGVLLASMTADEMIAQLIRNLNAVPFAKGVNNHMGSYLTAQSERMHQVFSVLKRLDLFFVDSRTSPETVCRASAQLFMVPFAKRDVFIDHFPDQPRIESQIRELVRLARKNGHAIGIGHPRRLTYQVLKEQKQYLTEAVQIVPASTLVKVVE